MCSLTLYMQKKMMGLNFNGIKKIKTEGGSTIFYQPKCLTKTIEEMKTHIPRLRVDSGSGIFMRSIVEKVQSVCSEVNPEREGWDSRLEKNNRVD